MLERVFTECLLRPGDLAPSDARLKVVGVFNPGVIDFHGRTAILARVVEQPVETRDDAFPSPRYEHGELVMDWLPTADTDAETDPRCYTIRSTGALRLRFISHLRVFFSEDGRSLDLSNPEAVGAHVLPDGPYETFGLEDPRVTVIEGTAYLTAVAVSTRGVCTALLSTTDFRVFTRHGLILPPDNKDVLLFPQRLAGDYLAIHRPMPNMPFSPPQMWLARSPDLVHWGSHQALFGAGATPQFQDRVGGSTPPVLTDRGWLTLYHGSNKTPGAKGVGTYTAGALLLDAENPSRILGYTPEPIMQPEMPYETTGFVNNVIFPSAAVRRGGELDVYYGAADENLAVTAFAIEDILDAIEPVPGA